MVEWSVRVEPREAYLCLKAPQAGCWRAAGSVQRCVCSGMRVHGVWIACWSPGGRGCRRGADARDAGEEPVLVDAREEPVLEGAGEEPVLEDAGEEPVLEDAAERSRFSKMPERSRCSKVPERSRCSWVL